MAAYRAERIATLEALFGPLAPRRTRLKRHRHGRSDPNPSPIHQRRTPRARISFRASAQAIAAATTKNTISASKRGSARFYP